MILATSAWSPYAGESVPGSTSPRISAQITKRLLVNGAFINRQARPGAAIMCIPFQSWVLVAVINRLI